MKYQNIILIGVFVLLIIVFYLFSTPKSKKEEEPIVEETKKEVKYYDVKLSGEFLRTGSYLIPSDWTLEMLFEYGGVKSEGDITGFTLTNLVEDNKEYFIPKKDIEPEKSKLTNINTADIDELIKLNGIGEVLANNIIEYRNQQLFNSIEDIKKVKGIGDFVYEKIKDFITVW